MKSNFFLTLTILSIIALADISISAQSEALTANQETTFSLGNKKERSFILDLSKGEYAEIAWHDKLERSLDISIIAPGGIDIVRNLYVDYLIPFVAKEDGKYKLTIKVEEFEDDRSGEITVKFSNVFKLPNSAKLQRRKMINGYDITVYNTSEEERDGYGTYLLIKKRGRLVDILKGGSFVGGGFNFAESNSYDDWKEGKKSAFLMRTTADKTGDGIPDLAVQFYSGGAHCCFDMHFYEFGKDEVRKLKTIEGRDSAVLAIGRQKNGGLILETGDSNFAYWHTSFAGSPIPTVLLTYQNGEFRPDVRLMKKPAPSLAVLKRKAAKVKMDLEPYTDDENGYFLEAFWGEMLDLMYSGNERSAWQFFDLVWDSRKQGKEKFKQNFTKKLNESEYWQSMSANKK